MNTGYEFLVEKDGMWARMFMEILRNNHIPCTFFPADGVGLAIRSGVRERLRIFVPAEKKPQAEELLGEIFGH